MAFKVIQIVCNGCGSKIEIDPTIRVGKCLWCGAVITVSKDVIPHNMTPVDYIFEDKIDKNKFMEDIKAHLCDDVDTPDELYDSLEQTELYMCYLPMFKYNIDWTAKWSADAGYRMSRERYNSSTKKTETEYYTEYRPVSGETIGVSTYCGPGSKTIEEKKLDEMVINLADNLPFELAEHFEPELLSGKTWLPYDKKDEDVFVRYIQEPLDYAIEKRCSDQVPGDTHARLSVSSKYTKTTEKILIPFWIFCYKWDDEMYVIVQDAVEGGIYGDPPSIISRMFKAFTLATVPIVGLIAGLILAYKSPDPDSYLKSPWWWGGGLLLVGILAPICYRAGLDCYRADFKNTDAVGRTTMIKSLRKWDKIYFWIVLTIEIVISTVYCIYCFYPINRASDICDKRVLLNVKKPMSANDTVKGTLPDVQQSQVKKTMSANDIYKKGLSSYSNKDYVDTIECFRLAANLGSAEAENMLGVCYYTGKGVSKDLGMAKEWWQKAAKNGYAAGQSNLAQIYYKEENYEQAVQLFTLSANQGNIAAQERLGYCYYTGKGISKDLGKAKEWLQKAAENGSAAGQFYLAQIYYKEENYEQAVKLFTLSANQGDVAAQERLGYCYYTGKGVSKDLGKAKEWLQKAAEKDHKKAIELLKKIDNEQEVSQQ